MIIEGHGGNTARCRALAAGAALKAMGHKVQVLRGWGSLSHMKAIRIDPKTGAMMVGEDRGRAAYPMGY